MLTPYGLTAAGAMLLLLLLTGFSCRRKGIPYRTFITFGALSLPLAFLLSRLTFALSNIPLYVNTLSNPLLMLHFWDGGASLLGREDIGALEVGKCCDLFLIDSRRLELVGACFDPKSVLATVGVRGAVDYTVVQGRVTVEQGHLVTVDEESLAREAEEKCRAYLNR